MCITRWFPRAVARAVLVAVVLLAGCAPRPRVGPVPATPADGAPAAGVVDRGGGGGDARRGTAAVDMAAVYRQMGLIGGRGDVPFVGTVAHFATRTPDSTLVLLALSLPNRALTFAREGDRYRAPYEVRLDVRRGAASVWRVAADEVVRVHSFKETARTDESVLFYQYLTLPPGQYALSAAMRDVESGRSTAVDVSLVVPRLGPGTLSTPVVVYEVVPRTRLDTLPRLAVSARAAITFGQDSLVPVYVEAYASALASRRVAVRAVARGERGAVLWSDTVALVAAPSGASTSGSVYAGVMHLPVSRLGIGVVSLTVARADAPADTVRAALFVSLGDDLPITGLDEVLGYLRYYALPERLRALRDAPPDARAGAWAAFLRDTDPAPATAEHEGLRDYFARVRAANVRFAEEGGAGWLTDRGLAFVGLGEPDQIFDPGGADANMRGRQQIWEYRAPRLQLVFVDQSGFGRWRLTPSSTAEVQAAIRQRMVK